MACIVGLDLCWGLRYLVCLWVLLLVVVCVEVRCLLVLDFFVDTFGLYRYCFCAFDLLVWYLSTDEVGCVIVGFVLVGCYGCFFGEFCVFCLVDY